MPLAGSDVTTEHMASVLAGTDFKFLTLAEFAKEGDVPESVDDRVPAYASSVGIEADGNGYVIYDPDAEDGFCIVGVDRNDLLTEWWVNIGTYIGSSPTP